MHFRIQGRYWWILTPDDGLGGFSHPITLKLDKRNLPDDKVDDAEMEDLLLGIVIRHLLFFLLNLPHQFFSLTHNK